MASEAVPVIEASGLKKAYGGDTVLDIDELAVERGEVLVILGPSGAGKSVLLRLLNLLEEPSEGVVRFEGVEVQGLEGRGRMEVSRRMAMIFQDPLLFRGSVADNAGYGLKVRRVPAGLRARRVAGILELVKMDAFAGKHVSTLSGGEAQRVALARSLVIEPEVLLLDEPFASLDTPTRHALQEDVKRILGEIGMTAVFVTHDQDEAARLGDRIVVLNNGRTAQAGSPREIFYEPKSEFVASFVGFENIYDARVVAVDGGLTRLAVDGREIEAVSDRAPGEKVKVGIRPEDVTLVPAADISDMASSRNALVGTVAGTDVRGPLARVTVECPFPVVAMVTSRSLEEMKIFPGMPLGLRFKATAVVVI